MRVDRATMKEPKFKIGEVVQHSKFDYRGVVYDIDLEFANGEEWYQKVARSRPPRDQPWYRVLVDGDERETYVAERHLKTDKSGDPVEHPELEDYFDAFENGHYVRNRDLN
jgi:heat shock protein HspQ